MTFPHVDPAPIAPETPPLVSWRCPSCSAGGVGPAGHDYDKHHVEGCLDVVEIKPTGGGGA